MRFPIESEGLGVVPENEPVLAPAGIFNLVIQAIHLALVGIKLSFADKGIIGRERAGAQKLRSVARIKVFVKPILLWWLQMLRSGAIPKAL